MMVAIYQANLQSFSGNMNTLHLGATLRIPQFGQLASVSANVESQEAALSQGGGEDSPRLRLVTSESTVASGGNVAAATAADDAIVAVAAELESELDSLRSEIESSQRLLEIRDQQLQDLRTQLEASVDREFELLFVDEAKQPTEMAPVVVFPAATTSVITPTVRPSLMPKILGWVLSPILLIGLGLITLTGTAVWYLRYREQTADDVTGRWEALEADLDGDDDTSSIVLEGSIHAGGDDIVVDESPDSDLEPFEVVGLTEESDLKVDVEIEGELEATEGLSPSDSTMTIGIPPSEPSHDDAISSQTVILDTEGNTHLDIGIQKSTGYETMSGRNNLLDPHTITMMEVATKLDLARAYVDMGDSDDARSILEEVLEEGDDDQQMEANKIIDDI
jgi:FimV-like protein